MTRHRTVASTVYLIAATVTLVNVCAMVVSWFVFGDFGWPGHLVLWLPVGVVCFLCGLLCDRVVAWLSRRRRR
jgi:hypothetical protein